MPSPMLLYTYPWMPYPRRVLIYLSEKGIPSSLIRIIDCGDSPAEKLTIDYSTLSVPPPPEGSLPILAIPNSANADSDFTYIRQSSAIMNYIGDTSDLPSMRATTPLTRARNAEIEGLADEVLTLWNAVRMTGSSLKGRAEGATATSDARISREIYALVRKRSEYIDKFLRERVIEQGGVFGLDGGNRPSISDVVLYSVLEFVEGFYGRDVTAGFDTMKRFKEEFGERKSAAFHVGRGYPVEMARMAREWDPQAL